MVGFCSHPRFVEHDTGPHHPERPDRIRAIHRAIRQAGMLQSPDPFPDFKLDFGLETNAAKKLIELQFSAADEKWLQLAHTPRHIDWVKQTCQAGGGLLDQADTPVCPVSFDIAMLALGGVLRACDAVANGEVKRCFAAVRPPGHHAVPDEPMGFCLFSNVAIAARYLQKLHGLGKIAIVDFDVHHGNGTQAVLESDPSVLFISIHEQPQTCYPGSGFDWEIGIGPGRGATINLPMLPGSDDAVYLQAFDSKIIPAVDSFRPEMLLISAGFDAHRDDPLADINLTEDGFEQITQKLVALADQHCRGRVVSALEGGYNLKALGRSVVRHILAMQ